VTRGSAGLSAGTELLRQTTVLYKLSLGEVVVTVPTVGANHETYTHGNTRFEVREHARHAQPAAAQPATTAFFL
jgi:hypothetical protein